MKTLLKNKIQTCETCSLNFTYKSIKRFCSTSCYYESLRDPSTKEICKCVTCQKSFNSYKYKNRKFCSNACAKGNCSKFKKTLPKSKYANCKICDKKFLKRTKHSTRCDEHYNKQYTTLADGSKIERVANHLILRNCIHCNSAYISKNKYFCSKTCSALNTNKTINDFSELNEISAYFAGFIFGDGHIAHKQNRISISLSQKYYTNYLLLVELSNYIFGENKVKVRNKSYHYSLGFGSKEIVYNLQRFGMNHNQKSLYDTLILPQYYTKDFIRGYFDADGWVSCRLNKKRYLTKNVGLCSYRKCNLEKINNFIDLNRTISSKKNQELYELRYNSYSDIKYFYDLINGYQRLEHKWNKLTFLSHLAP